jgi:hypothetical protein
LAEYEDDAIPLVEYENGAIPLVEYENDAIPLAEYEDAEDISYKAKSSQRQSPHSRHPKSVGFQTTKISAAGS